MALIVVCLFPGVGAAFCSSPYPPDPPSTFNRPNPPNRPYCLDAFSGTHTCDYWEIDSYNAAVQQYNYELEDYLRKLKQYVADAAMFADDALEYAKCEIRDLE